MNLQDCLKKMPAGKNFKRKVRQDWLKIYEDGTIRRAGSGRGPKKVEPLTVEDLQAEDWQYDHTPIMVSREDLLGAAKIVAKENGSGIRLSPVEVAKLLADQLAMD